MRLDDIGRGIRTNRVVITAETVTKQYTPFSIPALWGPLERKPYQSAGQRYHREKRLMRRLYDVGLNVPETLSFDDGQLVLTTRALELTDLVTVVEDEKVHRDDTLQYLKGAMELLRKIHDQGEAHGDPYLKNFFRLDRVYPDRGNVLTLDFEYERDAPDPQMVDILLLTASSMSALEHRYPAERAAPVALAKEVFGRVDGFPFDAVDRLFYRTRFGMDREFFAHFGERRTISVPAREPDQ